MFTASLSESTRICCCAIAALGRKLSRRSRPVPLDSNSRRSAHQSAYGIRSERSWSWSGRAGGARRRGWAGRSLPQYSGVSDDKAVYRRRREVNLSCGPAYISLNSKVKGCDPVCPDDNMLPSGQRNRRQRRAQSGENNCAAGFKKAKGS